jgi:hypothetical protein
MTPTGTRAEGSLIGRFVAIITPFFTLFAGWLGGVVAHAMPGVKLDRGQIVAFMVAVATATLTTAWKWLQGWQQHEQNVADGKSAALVRPDAPLAERVLGRRAARAPDPASEPSLPAGAVAAQRVG